MNDDATIFALASAAGKAGVAVFRISGPHAKTVIEKLCYPATLPAPRRAVMRSLVAPLSCEKIDQALVLYFPNPHSFTGEDTVELHCHGGRAVCAAVTQALQNLEGYRLAEPGEFTRRAFENGKFDLTEAEAVADLVHAENEAQRKQALRQLDGSLGVLYEGWRTALSRSLAYMEAAIDFADDELPEDLIERQTALLRNLRDAITAHLNDNHRGERLRDGFMVAILGRPNAGKSSLLNLLARRDAAIVSPTAGTTRDVIEVPMDIGGYPVTLADTAGLRDSGDAIEQEGMRRAVARAEAADLNILVIDATDPIIDDATRALMNDRTLIVVNKSDLIENSALPFTLAQDPVFISAKTGAGLDAFMARLTKEIDDWFRPTDAPPLTRARHRAALQNCVDHLDRALAVFQADMRAEDVRLAMRALGRITGRVDVEDLLDIIFRDFCIGK
jgi:tRNA modification GTPase